MANTSLEYIASNAEDAIQKGLRTLGLTRDQVDIEIIDAGSRGIFGFGSRQARVRIALKEDALRASLEQEQSKAEEEKASLEVPAEAPQEEKRPQRPEKSERGDKPERKSEKKFEKQGEKQEKKFDKSERKARKENAPAPEKREVKPERPVATVTDDTPENAEPKHSSSEVVSEETMQIASNVVRDLMEKMRVKAEINARITDGADEMDSRVILIDIKGNDLSYLIGRHSEVLHSLQYITGLIVGREVGHWVPLVIDIQGYRERRERQLRQMANTMADQVIKTGRRISLEPMPATERRVIHLALRENKEVVTESVGDEPNRKVMIYPKERK